MRFEIVGLALLVSPGMFAQRVSFGFQGGVNLTRDFPTSSLVYFEPSFPDGLTTFERYSDRRGFIAGMSIEVDLGKGLSAEGNALRRQLQLKLRSIFPDGSVNNVAPAEIGTWEWPILIKYRTPGVRAVRPFVEAGPSFRTRHNPVPSEPSQIGATFGAGAEVYAGRFRVSPALRYTRWQYDGNYPRIATKRDQLEFVTGISYATSLPSWRLGGKSFGLELWAVHPLLLDWSRCLLRKGWRNPKATWPGWPSESN